LVPVVVDGIRLFQADMRGESGGALERLDGRLD